MEDYLILGACNPPLAHQALQADRSIGLLLPCNVVARRDGDTTLVQALDPNTMVTLSGLPALEPVAGDAAARLDAALAAWRVPLPGPQERDPCRSAPAMTSGPPSSRWCTHVV
jgi:hypothetical protein